MNNIFVEGIQGAGKSFLLRYIQRENPGLSVCWEGDYSPVDLAWCAYLTEADYRQVLEQYKPISEEIKRKTVKEGNRYVVPYTKILTDIPGFHKELEKFELYNGRRPFREFQEIVFSRYEAFAGTGYVFECAFFQNIMENLMLYELFEDAEILAFYRELYRRVKKGQFFLVYLFGDSLEENIHVIRKERSDEQGREQWYPLMMEYFRNSPYGKKHGCGTFEDLICHFRRRQQLELRIIKEIFPERARILPAKKWTREELSFLPQ